MSGLLASLFDAVDSLLDIIKKTSMLSGRNGGGGSSISTSNLGSSRNSKTGSPKSKEKSREKRDLKLKDH